MTFALLARRTTLLATRRATASASSTTSAAMTKRRMGGSAAPAPEWEGIDKVVRGYFPQDDQLAAAIIGGYFGLYILIKIGGAISGSAPVEEAPVAAAVVPSSAAGAIPDVDSEEFGAFLESEDNIMKLVESFEK